MYCAGVLWADEPSNKTSDEQKTSSKQSASKFQGEITIQVEMDYLVYLPETYADNKNKWPLVVFLHGSGESGSDLEKVKVHGPPKHVEAGEKFPFILVSPQASSARRGWEPAVLNAMIDQLISTHRIDSDRIYLTGLSMGGYGTWAMAQAYPEKFAAIMPICGGGDATKASLVKHLPIWIFHGEKDEAVPVQRSEEMVKALQECGSANVKFTRYAEVGHDSWTETYCNPEVWSWLLQQTKLGKLVVPQS
jgi:predicted peptidase